MSDHDQALAEAVSLEAARIQALGETAPRLARDPINQPMINNWLEAIGESLPRYTAGEAPPAMAQVWTMGGLHPQRDPNDPLHSMMQFLTDAGYTAVLGTNCEQTYHRYLRVGERVSVTTTLDAVVGPKQTGVGVGYFVTTKSTWRVGEEEVATMLFRVLKYRPKGADSAPGDPAVDPTAVLRPTRNADTEFFWEGTQAGELRIQSCADCGALRHPPGPACPECGALSRTHVVAAGTGTLFSYVIHRHPPVPGKTLPLLLGLVELDEGVRMVAELRGLDEEAVRIDLPVQVAWQRIDDDLTLPVFEPRTP